MLTILHTSDWHLGRALYGRSRYREFAAFLDWLVATVEREAVDVLLIAGDVFDTSAPSNRAQELYYRFLCRISAVECRHVVVIAGNHDSPSFLDAPRELLRTMHVHVVGTVGDSPEDEVVTLWDKDGTPQLIVCAVPYLRDRVVRTVEPGEGVEDKERKLVEGIRDHWAAVVACAEEQRARLGLPLPIVGMGHVFTAGGRTVEGDGVRDLYVGSLAHIPAAAFPAGLDYLALGHLHEPQVVGGCQFRRYSGSPVPMGFGEAGRPKSVCLVRFDPQAPAPAPEIRLVGVPVFQRLERIVGGWAELSLRIRTLAEQGKPVWLEVVYDGEDVVGNLRELLDETIAGTSLEILRVKNNRIVARILEQGEHAETIDDLDVDEIFTRCLDTNRIPKAQRQSLRHAYRQIVTGLLDADLRPGERGAA